MNWKEILAKWKNNTPTEEKRDKVIKVIENVFHKWKWNIRGSHIIVEDERLKLYKRKLNPNNKDISHEGSFHVPTRGKKVIGVYLDKIIEMIEIIEAFERSQK